MKDRIDYTGMYADFLRTHVKLARPIKAVFDASNGSAGPVLHKVFERIPHLTPIFLETTPDPCFSAHGPNPIAEGATRAAAAEVRRSKADIGFVFDADGDRVVVLDNKGHTLPAYAIIGILAADVPPPFVVDEITYMTLTRVPFFKGKLIRSLVGTLSMKKYMKYHKASVGGEYSGHYYFKSFFGSDSGIFAAIMLMNSLSRMRPPLSRIATTVSGEHIIAREVRIGTHGSSLMTRVEEKFRGQGIIEKKDGLSVTLPSGWVNIRMSKTEPLIRITAGAKEKRHAEELAEKVLVIAHK